MNKSNKKRYYENNKKYYSKKKKKKENVMEEKKITYEELVNAESADDSIIDFPVSLSDNENIMQFVFISIVIMAIVFGSLLLFHVV